MFRRWVAFALAGLAAACGERTGEPIVARPLLDAEAGAPAVASGGAAGSDAGQGDGGVGSDTGPAGLCTACTTSTTCGDANDACIRNDGATFCGRDCDESNGCPTGYLCVELGNTRLEQCVPLTGCPEPASMPPSLAEVRQYLLGRINLQRLARDRSALGSSVCLDDLAQSSALAYARTDEPLGKYIDECDPIWPACACGWSAEAEIAVAQYGLDWASAIESALAESRFSSSYLDFDFTAVGIGFWLSGDEAWLALSFR